MALALFLGGVAVLDAAIGGMAFEADGIIHSTQGGFQFPDATIQTTAFGLSTVGAAEVIDASLTGAEIQNGSLTGSHIQNESVTASDIATGAVGGSEVANGSLQGIDVANGSLTGTDVADGSLRVADRLDEAGVDFAGGLQIIALSSTDTVVRLVTIAAPTSGFVVANATGWFSFPSTTSVARCLLTTGTVVDSNDLGTGVIIEDWDIPFALTKGFAVGAGNTTIRLVCDSELGGVSIRNTHLTAIFSPTRY